jgi:hypothetical protein
MNRNNNTNNANLKNKITNKNKSNSASSRIQSTSSDVFENSDMDIDDFLNYSKNSGYRNLSSSDEPSTNKIAKTTQKCIF